MLMDAALNESSFIKTFFHTEDSSLFMEVFKDASKYVVDRKGSDG